VSPRVREDSVHPRLQSGFGARPLNFTVRGRVLALLVYETTDPDFANRAMDAMRDAAIPCYRTGRGYSSDSNYPGKGFTEDQVCIYIERDTDFAQANEILIGLGAVTEDPERLLPKWVFALFAVTAVLLAFWIAAAWK